MFIGRSSGSSRLTRADELGEGRVEMADGLLQRGPVSLRPLPAPVAAVLLEAGGHLEGPAGPEVPDRALEVVGRLLEPAAIPLVDRPADLRHPSRAFAQEEPGQFLEQL